ncbi:MAG: hypothetical protein EOO06_02475 [Chitinophagaceae bacterium]|nr:MAG: hypothetical protein EOO06_02475 [Chitinophagaceae bacterium]
MKTLQKIRALILFIVVAIILSGVTAFPVETELAWLLRHPSIIPDFAESWLQEVYKAISETNQKYPMLSYGFDWLAFAHLVIAMAFIGPYRDPIKNEWVIDWAMLACVAVFPLAFIAGPIREIPLFHIMIDCAFGFFGLIPLYICKRWIQQLKKQKAG